MAEGLGPGIGEGAVVLPVGDFGRCAEAGLQVPVEGLSLVACADESEFVQAVAEDGVGAFELLIELGDF